MAVQILRIEVSGNVKLPLGSNYLCLFLVFGCSFQLENTSTLILIYVGSLVVLISISGHLFHLAQYITNVIFFLSLKFFVYRSMQFR